MATTQIDRQAIHEVMTQLDAKGELTPDLVIKEARKNNSPLHSCFTWDVQEAALKTWRNEARTLISSFTVERTVNHTVYKIQEFVEATAKGDKEQGYTSIDKIKNSKELAREFLDRELGIASTYVSKTKDYAEVLGLRKRVEDVASDINELRAEVWGRPQA